MTPEEWYGKLETKPDIPLPEQEKQPAMSPEEWYGKLEINPLGDIGGLSGKAGPTVTSTVPKKDLPPPVTNKAGQTFPDFLVSETGKGIAGMLTTPGKAYQHGLTPEEETNWAGGMSLNMLGQTPFAPKGSAGLFGGRLAANADLSNLSLAEAMHAKGMDRHQIWDATGWFQGADGQWRFEIPDDNFNLKSYSPSDIGALLGRLSGQPLKKEGKGLTGEQGYIEHFELAKAYPEFAELKHVIRPGGSSYDMKGNTIKIGSAEHAEQASTALHELMHAIQEKEGWNMGSDPAAFKDIISQLVWEEKGFEFYHSPQGRKFINKVAQEAYMRLSGEVEARNVERRARMTPQERKQMPPWATEDRYRGWQVPVTKDYWPKLKAELARRRGEKKE